MYFNVSRQWSSFFAQKQFGNTMLMTLYSCCVPFTKTGNSATQEQSSCFQFTKVALQGPLAFDQLLTFH